MPRSTVFSRIGYQVTGEFVWTLGFNLKKYFIYFYIQIANLCLTTILKHAYKKFRFGFNTGHFVFFINIKSGFGN